MDEKSARWCLGPSPKSLDDSNIEIVRQLFLDQTGERYARESVRTLPIPEWMGNLVLLDSNNMIRGFFGQINSKKIGLELLHLQSTRTTKVKDLVRRVGIYLWKHLLVMVTKRYN